MAVHKKIHIYADGGSRGNPGPSGIGVILFDDDGNTISQLAEFIGKTTNNQAEYQALIMGLQEALVYGAWEVTVHLDSQLLVNQLTGEYRVKNENIKKLFFLAQNLIKKFKKVKFIKIPRSENFEADKLVNQAINRGIGSGIIK